MRRTLLISEVFPPQVGGSGRYLWEIYRRRPRGEVVVAAGEHPRQEAFDRAHDLDVVRLPLALAEPGVLSPRGLGGYGRAVRALRRLAKDRGVDQVHCARCVVEGWMGWLLKRWCGLPYLCYAHGEEVKLASAGDGGFGVMSSRQLRWMARRALRGADLLICNSRNTARILTEEWGLPAARLALLHPGVDIRRFVPAPRDLEVRDRLGWGERPVLLTVARLQGRKGHDRMIRALHRVRQEVPDVLYAIAGDGSERPALERLVAAEGLGGHVRFLGEVDDEALVACYQQCDLFVHPNRQVGRDIEGFGMVLLEAQACGKPVVAGDSGGTAETMRIPETGLVVPCDDHRPLGELVAGLLVDGDRLDRMGGAARRWVVEHFDWDVLARRAGRIFAREVPDAMETIPVLEGRDAMNLGQRMQDDWDAMARQNAHYYIATVDEFADPAKCDDALFFESGKVAVETILAALRIRPDPGWRVLDIGCGLGRLTRGLGERFGPTVGIDVSEEMVRRARQLTPGVEFRKTSGVDLAEFPDGTFDLVFSFIVLQHLPRARLVLGYIAEMARVLKPGGIAAFQVPTSFFPAWKRAYWKLLRRRHADPHRNRPSFQGTSLSVGQVQRHGFRVGLATEMILHEGHYYTYFRMCKATSEELFAARPGRLGEPRGLGRLL